MIDLLAVKMSIYLFLAWIIPKSGGELIIRILEIIFLYWIIKHAIILPIRQYLKPKKAFSKAGKDFYNSWEKALTRLKENTISPSDILKAEKWIKL